MVAALTAEHLAEHLSTHSKAGRPSSYTHPHHAQLIPRWHMMSEVLNEYKMTLPLPGLRAGALSVSYGQHRMLILQGEDAVSGHTLTVSTGLRLPWNANPVKVMATAQDGVITIILPKRSRDSSAEREEFARFQRLRAKDTPIAESGAASSA